MFSLTTSGLVGSSLSLGHRGLVGVLYILYQQAPLLILHVAIMFYGLPSIFRGLTYLLVLVILPNFLASAMVLCKAQRQV